MKPRFYQIEGEPGLVRDMQSQAVLNTDVQSFEAYKKQRNERLRVRKMLDDYEVMKSDLSEIKMLLKMVLDKT